MPRILILNGPNLNMLGVREPEIYGSQSLSDIQKLCEKEAEGLGISVEFRQSNHEGELVEWIQQARGNFDAVLINAAAYTHTSVAIHDALKLLEIPVAEVHLSDPESREAFRHHSYVRPVAAVYVAGKGAQGYVDALQSLCGLIAR